MPLGNIFVAKIYLLLRHLMCVIHLESGANPQASPQARNSLTHSTNVRIYLLVNYYMPGGV